MPVHFTDIPYPAADDDAANKKYVDDQTGGGGGGGGIPAGGTTGQQLTKDSNADFDVSWAAAGGGGGSGGMPAGGTTGQQLTKLSNTDFDVDWEAAGFRGVNHQTGTSYNVAADTDREKLVTLANASPVSVILPATSSGDQREDYSDIDSSSYVFDQFSSGILERGQSFTCTIGGVLKRAAFVLKRRGAPTGNAVAKLYAHTGTYGTSSVPGTLLATSDNVDVTTIPSWGGLINFNFSTSYTLVAGTHYCIVAAYAGSTDPDNCVLQADSFLPGHSGNEVELTSTGWFGDPAEESIFYVYTIGPVVPPVVNDKWLIYFENLGSGLVTISTADSSIDGFGNKSLAQNAGIIIACDGSSYYTCRGEGLGTIERPVTVSVSGSDFTTSSTSLVDIPGLIYALEGDALYEIEVMLSGAGSDTNGVQHSLAFSAAGATGHFMLRGCDTTTAVVNEGQSLGTVTATAIWRALNTRMPCEMKTMVKAGANPGNITVQIKKNVAGSVTVYTGSRMTVTRIS